MSYTLTDQERVQLTELRDAGSVTEARRAAIILLSADGARTGAIADAVGLSTSQVGHWRREWRARRLDIFPSLNSAAEVHSAASSAANPAAEAAAEVATVPGVAGPRRPLELRAQVGVEPSDPMAEAGRKVLLYHFERMLLNEPGSRLGEDIEAVHDMRVATRRMRSALRVFAPYFKPKAIQPYKSGLRHVARLLGAVRDLDVFIEKAQRFEAKHGGVDLTPIIELWEANRDFSRSMLISYLDSSEFATFVQRFDTFLNQPGKGSLLEPESPAGIAAQVRYLVPGLIYERFEHVRVYETTLDHADVSHLHALRIEFKRFRYALEFFADVLGDSVREVIAVCKAMQDHLGDLNDAEVAIEELSAFVAAHNAEFSGVPQFMRPDISGVEDYLAAKHDERARLLATFPAAWATFTGSAVRRDLALAVAAL